MDKLTWFNAEYMRKLSFEEFYELARPWMARVLDPERFDLRRLAELLQARIEVLNRIPGMIGFLAEMPESVSYTHLDVYKRQGKRTRRGAACRGAACRGAAC